MSDTFYVASKSDADGTNLSRFISLLGIAPRSPATFEPTAGAPLDHAWDVWQNAFFIPLFAPSFIDVFGSAARMDIAAIRRADEKIDATLSAGVKRKSVEAGKPFLDGKSEMKANREWIRFAEQVVKGDSPGHLCVLFAVQAALYHLPLPAALSAYAFYEFQSRLGVFPFRTMTPQENEVFSSVLPRIPLAVQRKSAENTGGDTPFRVL